jgi:hypothetical protein
MRMHVLKYMKWCMCPQDLLCVFKSSSLKLKQPVQAAYLLCMLCCLNTVFKHLLERSNTHTVCQLAQPQRETMKYCQQDVK